MTARLANPVLRALAALALLLPAVVVPAQRASAAPVELDRVVAIVNNDVIVMSELQDRIRTIRAQLRQSGTPLPPPQVLRKQVLERLILERLQLQIAKQMGLHVDDETLNTAVKDIAKQNNLSLRDFRSVLERDGFNFAKFREQVRDEILIQQVRQRQIETRVTVSNRDIDNYLATVEKQRGKENEYHLGHILVALPEGASSEQIAAAKTKAEGIMTKLRGGADFAEVAVAQSDGQQALQGGDLGWRKAAELPTFFADVVPKLKPGELAGPIRTPSGFHIIKLIDVRGQKRHVTEQTHVRHILLRTNEANNDHDVARRLNELRTRILNGEDFAALARSHSEDRTSAVKGGDLGWVNPGDMVPDFEAVMNSLKVGEVSRPFKTRFGWHIVQVLGRRKHDDTEKVRRARAAEQIRKRKTDEEVQTWLRQLRDEAYVEVRLDEP